MRLSDRKVVVTGGPTREWIDPVRFISNPSSGKMGIALADAANSFAKETVFIHGPINGDLVKGKPYRCVPVNTTEDLLRAVMAELVDDAVLIMAAAPADYRPAETSTVKLKKAGDELVLRLIKNPDILMAVAEKRSRGELKNLFVVGFAAETTDTESYALDKLARKNMEMICLNDVSAGGAGFGTDTNIITLFTKEGGRTDLPLQSKDSAAAAIVEEIRKALE